MLFENINYNIYCSEEESEFNYYLAAIKMEPYDTTVISNISRHLGRQIRDQPPPPKLSSVEP